LGNSYLGTGARFDAVQRQYDAFVESNLRNSNSDLEGQKPLLSYVNRLIDVMGDESIGLTTAMNRFFESSRDLASDPASVVSRSSFLRDAEGLAARFQQLAGQFELLDNETRQSVDTDVGQINSLTQQLGLLNKQMVKHSSVDSQPSELLDQRDRLLRELSGLISVKTKFEPNGAVMVSVGDTLDQGILVDKANTRAISVEPSAIDSNKLTFVIDAYGKPETMPGISSGKIGGVMNFREQVLSPAFNSLNDLAEVMAREINAIHREGVDAEGLLGGDLFAFSADKPLQAAGMQLIVKDANRVAAAGQFRVIDNPLNSGTAQARVVYNAPDFEGPTALLGELALAQVPQIGQVTVSTSASQPFASLGVVPVGTQDLSLTLQNPNANQSFHSQRTSIADQNRQRHGSGCHLQHNRAQRHGQRKLPGDGHLHGGQGRCRSAATVQPGHARVVVAAKNGRRVDQQHLCTFCRWDGCRGPHTQWSPTDRPGGPPDTERCGQLAEHRIGQHRHHGQRIRGQTGAFARKHQHHRRHPSGHGQQWHPGRPQPPGL
jgi:flagellar hook-associated protein FlgK